MLVVVKTHGLITVKEIQEAIVKKIQVDVNKTSHVEEYHFEVKYHETFLELDEDVIDLMLSDNKEHYMINVKRLVIEKIPLSFEQL